MFQQALTLQRQGQLREAEKAYTRVVKAAPDYFDALNLLGTVKAQLGQAGEAYRLIHAALKINPRASDAWINLGLVQHALKRDADALESFDKALALKPDDLDARHHRGNALISLARTQEALTAFEQVLAIDPGHNEARVNRGATLAQLGRHDEAIADFDAALAANAQNPVAHYNRGVALFSLGRYAAAVAACDAALALAPDHARAWNDRGRALAALNRHEEAIASYGKALAIDKDYADAHFNEALALLTVGDFRRGFAQYEWRWRRTGMPAQRKYSRPLWLGDYALPGKTILLHAEQGLGDTIQFARYIPLLARAGAKVVLEVQPELQTLFAPLEGVTSIAARGAALPAFDRHCPLGSLPLAFKTEPGAIPAGIPYLRADDAHLAKWRPRIAALGTAADRARLVRQCVARQRSQSLDRLRRAGTIAGGRGCALRWHSARRARRRRRVTGKRGPRYAFRRRTYGFRRYRGRRRACRSGYLRRYRCRPPRRRDGSAGLGSFALFARLALGTHRRNQQLVSDRASVPAAIARRLGKRYRTRRRGA